MNLSQSICKIFFSVLTAIFLTSITTVSAQSDGSVCKPGYKAQVLVPPNANYSQARTLTEHGTVLLNTANEFGVYVFDSNTNRYIPKPTVKSGTAMSYYDYIGWSEAIGAYPSLSYNVFLQINSTKYPLRSMFPDLPRMASLHQMSPMGFNFIFYALKSNFSTELSGYLIGNYRKKVVKVEVPEAKSFTMGSINSLGEATAFVTLPASSPYCKNTGEANNCTMTGYWSPNSGMKILNPQLSLERVVKGIYGYGLNSKGQVTARAELRPSELWQRPYSRALLLNARDHSAVDLLRQAPHLWEFDSAASALNESGVVVGTIVQRVAPYSYEPVIFSSTGGAPKYLTEYLADTGVYNSNPIAINTRGQILLNARISNLSTGSRAVLLTPTTCPSSTTSPSPSPTTSPTASPSPSPTTTYTYTSTATSTSTSTAVYP